MLTDKQIEAIASILLAPYNIAFNVVVNLECPLDIPVQIFIRRPDSKVCVMNFFLTDITHGEGVFALAFEHRVGDLNRLLPRKEVAHANR